MLTRALKLELNGRQQCAVLILGILRGAI